jgi:CRISPR-associated protein Cas5d
MAAFNGKPSDLHQYASLERQQRASLLLRDVSYIIEAHFEMTDRAGPDDTEEKHYNIAVRRLRKGQCYYQPYLGCREFSAKVELLEGDIPASFYTGTEKDLGWMLWDIDYSNDKKPLFFRPVMKNGIIEVPDLLKKGGMS